MPQRNSHCRTAEINRLATVDGVNAALRDWLPPDRRLVLVIGPPPAEGVK